VGLVGKPFNDKPKYAGFRAFPSGCQEHLLQRVVLHGSILSVEQLWSNDKSVIHDDFSLFTDISVLIASPRKLISRLIAMN
jgi:hypothetical protein